MAVVEHVAPNLFLLLTKGSISWVQGHLIKKPTLSKVIDLEIHSRICKSDLVHGSPEHILRPTIKLVGCHCGDKNGLSFIEAFH